MLLARGKIQLVKRALKEGKDYDYGELFAKRAEQCLMCGNCSQNCPAGICTEEIIEKTREACVNKLGVKQALEMTAQNVEKVGNITGDSRENRLLWFQNMEPGSVKVGGKAEYIYFAGCVPTLYPSSYSIPQNFSLLMNKAGVDWTVMGDQENCCSYPLILGGLREKAIKTIEQNVSEIKATGAKTLVTTCPSCYHMWKEVYPEIVSDMPKIEVMHSTQLLAKLVKENKFKFKETNCTVTYHDPCDLGRKSGIFDEPREVLLAIPGVTFKEMKFNKKNAFCCGGGGNLEMNDSELSGKVAQQRIEQALETGADILVTSCQQCKRTISGGARAKRARIKIMELGEFMMSAVE
jgi:Fe-S oxidoreductase